MEQLTRVSNVDSCLDFVASEDPDFDASLPHCADCLRDIFLKFVLDRGGADQQHVLLNLGLDFLHPRIPIHDLPQCRLKPFIPLLIVVFIDFFLGQEQSPQALRGILVDLDLRFLHELSILVIVQVEPRLDNRVGAFAEERDLIGLQVANDHAHPLTCRCELKDVE